MRLFDLRALEHSTILYETNHQSTTGEGKPLLKLGWNNQDPSYSPKLKAL